MERKRQCKLWFFAESALKNIIGIKNDDRYFRDLFNYYTHTIK
jgi:hypothetical protein